MIFCGENDGGHTENIEGREAREMHLVTRQPMDRSYFILLRILPSPLQSWRDGANNSDAKLLFLPPITAQTTTMFRQTLRCCSEAVASALKQQSQQKRPSYFIQRNTNGNLPVYSDIRNAGSRFLVQIRNVDGNVQVSAVGRAGRNTDV